MEAKGLENIANKFHYTILPTVINLQNNLLFKIEESLLDGESRIKNNCDGPSWKPKGTVLAEINIANLKILCSDLFIMKS